MVVRDQKTNFIHHQLKVRELFAVDERLSAFHVSLYFALFFEWNDNRFKSPFFISRSEIMNGAKIGNTNTYTKYLKQLDLFGYIEYKPSYNPNIGSTINMYTFDNGCDNGTDKGCDNCSGKGSVQVVLPFNKENKQKKDKKMLLNFGGVDLKKIDQAKKEQVDKTLFSKVTGKDELLSSIPPHPTDLKNYFIEKESSEEESQKFFNHFESNGWLVGGKTKMKNWQAAARNWILNSVKFQSQKKQSSPGNLNVNQNKDYSVPL